MKKTYCFYQIPEFIIGTPIYDINEMRKYVINSLKTNGFKIMYVEPNWLFISWIRESNKKLVNKEFKKEIKEKEKNKYKSIDGFKPTGSLIYDESTMLGLSNKFI